jgi:hypothetical protein
MYLIYKHNELKKEAIAFWSDDSNSFDDRVKCFNHFAEYDSFYPDESHPLGSLFIWYRNHYDCDRYRLYDWEDIINTYLEKHSDRSSDLIDRVYNYLSKLMIKGGYKGFEYDW